MRCRGTPYYSFVVISDELDSSLASVIHRLESFDKIPCGLKTPVLLPRVVILTEPSRVGINNIENVMRSRPCKF